MKYLLFKHVLLCFGFLMSNPVLAQYDYDLDIRPEGDRIDYTIATFFGVALGDDHFTLKGPIGMQVPTATAPFGTGVLKGANVGTLRFDPDVYNYIRNPIPGSPPLIESWVRDMEFYLLSGNPFPIHPVTGQFSTIAMLSFTKGEIEVLAFGSTQIISLVGTGTDPFPLYGYFKQYGGKLELDILLQVQWSGDLGGLTVSLDTNGYSHAECLVAGLNPALAVSSLVAGQTATFDFTGGVANASSWLTASIYGPGLTPVPPLHVDSGLDRPIVVVRGISDTAGTISWPLTVPALPGLAVWFQVVQMGVVSPVVAATIQ